MERGTLGDRFQADDGCPCPPRVPSLCRTAGCQAGTALADLLLVGVGELDYQAAPLPAQLPGADVTSLRITPVQMGLSKFASGVSAYIPHWQY